MNGWLSSGCLSRSLLRRYLGDRLTKNAEFFRSVLYQGVLAEFLQCIQNLLEEMSVIMLLSDINNFFFYS